MSRLNVNLNEVTKEKLLDYVKYSYSVANKNKSQVFFYLQDKYTDRPLKYERGYNNE